MSVVSELVTLFTFKSDTKPLDHIGEQLEGIKRRLEFLGAVEVAKGIYEMVERFGEFAEQLTNSAAAAGITTEAFQKAAYAASQSGVSVGELSGAMAKLSRNLYAARNGSSEAVEAFAKVGITPAQIAGFKNTDEAMDALADAIAATEDPIKRQALSMQLLGRGSSTLVNHLSKGSAAIRGMKAQATAAAAVISDKDMVALEEGAHAVTSFGMTLKALGGTIAAQLSPSVVAIVKHLTAFIARNRELFATTASRWVYKFSYGIGFLYGVISAFAQQVLDLIKLHPKLADAVKDAFVTIGGALTVLMSPLGSVIKGFGSMALGIFDVGKASAKWIAKALTTDFADMAEAVASKIKGVLGFLRDLSTRLFEAGVEGAKAWGKILGPIGLALAVGYELLEVYRSIRDVLSGVKFEDTDIGKMFNSIGLGGIGDLQKSLGFSGEKQKFEDANPGKTYQGSDTGASVGSAMARLTDLIHTIGMTSLDGRPEMSAGATINNAPTTINSNVSLTIPPSLDPKAAAEAVQRGVAEHFAKVTRQANNAIKTPVLAR